MAAFRWLRRLLLRHATVYVAACILVLLGLRGYHNVAQHHSPSEHWLLPLRNNMMQAQQGPDKTRLGTRTVVLVLVHNRPRYLQRCLAALVRYHPGDSALPVMVSEDTTTTAEGIRAQLAAVVREAGEKLRRKRAAANRLPDALGWEGIRHISFHDPHWPSGDNSYARLGRHYKWALNCAFAPRHRAQRVIVLEEDIEIASDFFFLLGAVAPLLDEPSENLLAVSTFNDNGVSYLVDEGQDSGVLLRSDFFPGLGWMLTRTTWLELASNWPATKWDDWIRHPATRKGRHTLRPEISRSFHFGIENGSSTELYAEGNQLGDFHRAIVLHSEPPVVDWGTLDLTLLRASAFHLRYTAAVRNATSLTARVRAFPYFTPAHLDNFELQPGTSYCVAYPANSGSSPGSVVSSEVWAPVARQFGLLPDGYDIGSAGVPRSSYEGIVQFRSASGARVFVAPSNLCIQ